VVEVVVEVVVVVVVVVSAEAGVGTTVELVVINGGRLASNIVPEKVCFFIV
jgi:hypothetical protein